MAEELILYLCLVTSCLEVDEWPQSSSRGIQMPELYKCVSRPHFSSSGPMLHLTQLFSGYNNREILSVSFNEYLRYCQSYR